MSKIAPTTLLLACLGAAPAQADPLQEVQALIQQGQYAQALERAQQLQQNPPSEAQLRALREMRKHVGWYLRGFAVGGPARHALGLVSSLAELHERLGALDLTQPFPAAAEGPRGRAGGEKTPHLPEGWLDSPVLTDAERAQLHLAEVGVSGG